MPFYITSDNVTLMKIDALVCPQNPKFPVEPTLLEKSHYRGWEAELPNVLEIEGTPCLKPAESRHMFYSHKLSIHPVLPDFSSLSPEKTDKALEDYYLKSMRLATANDCESVVIPFATTGTPEYDDWKALSLATLVISTYPNLDVLTVYLLVDWREKLPADPKLFPAVNKFVENNYEEPEPLTGLSFDHRVDGSDAPDDVFPRTRGPESPPKHYHPRFEPEFPGPPPRPASARLPDTGEPPVKGSKPKESVLKRLFSRKRKPEAASERDSAAGSAKVPESSRETERDRDFDGVCATFGPGPEDLDEPEAKSAKETPEKFGERFKETIERRREAGLAPEEFFERLEEPFSVTLMEMIAKKGMTPVEVYTKANIDRKHFSKIRTIEGYVPSKRTILSLAVAMKLRLDETETFLKRAGYALSRSQKMDLVVEYFIIHHKYDVFAINEALYHYDLPLLGAN